MPSRVLVVDDDAAVCELIEEVLKTVEIEAVPITHSGLAATQLAREKFDAVFLDVHMPSPDGIELTKKIRSGGFNVSTPVIVITGEEDRDLLARAFEAGANFLLYKPVDRRNILSLVRATRRSIDNERRRFRRVKVECRVSLECGSARTTGQTVDLSLGGMLVKTPCVLPEGSVARASIETNSGSPLTVTAKVLRIANGDCMAMQFEKLGVHQAKQLQEFLLPMVSKLD